MIEKRRRKGSCRICSLDQTRKKIVETLILDTGDRTRRKRKEWERSPEIIERSKLDHRRKRLTADQICYVVYVILALSFERHIIYKHKKHMEKVEECI